MSLVYFDNAAATPMDPSVISAMQPYFSELFYNPSATYRPARQVHDALDDARSRVAHWIGARPSEIIFTAGGTEANNLAIAGVMAAHPGGHVIVSGIEHDSVLMPAQQFNCSVALVTEQGRLDLDDFAAKIKPNTVIVSVMYANNEVGTIQPIRAVSQLLQKIRDERRTAGNDTPLYFHTDACQAANYLDLHASRLGIDLMTLNGGKIYGPKQSGVLYVASHVRLQPLIRGGGQERGFRSGTENVAAAIGFARALEISQEMHADEGRRLNTLQLRMIEELQRHIPSVVINGALKSRLPNNVHFTIPGTDNERLLIQLERRGFLAAAGSACSASNEEPSHVLRAMGLDDDLARASLRVTMGRSTSEDDVRAFVESVVACAVEHSR